jgi:histidine ammonia-lyase
MVVLLDGATLTLENVIMVAGKGEKVKISKTSMKRMEKFREVLQQKLDSGEIIYGVNTGFGFLSQKGISNDDVRQLQLNLIRSHAVGVGEPMPQEVVRAATLIRLNGMLNGNSGVRPELATFILSMLNGGVNPYVPSIGSLGASGDLAPSAHMALTMIGEGRAYHRGKLMDGADALGKAKLRPVELQAKEGLALINGTCFTTALACVVAHRGRVLLGAANSGVAMTSEVLGGCLQSFDDRLMKLRRLRSQSSIAKSIRAMLKGSGRVRISPLPQDPYSVRCAPQVHGATLEALAFAEGVLSDELNSGTDNPVFIEDGQVLHGGNFHAQMVAMALDFLCIAVAYLGTLSLARTHLMLSSGPPENKFGARHPGLESGLMVTEYTASALAAENAKEVYPSSTYPANVSAGIEDHASYGVTSGLKALKVVSNVSKMIAVELIVASNMASTFYRDLSTYDAHVRNFVREISPTLQGDRSLSEDLERLSQAILQGGLPHAPDAE